MRKEQASKQCPSPVSASSSCLESLPFLLLMMGCRPVSRVSLPELFWVMVFVTARGRKLEQPQITNNSNYQKSEGNLKSDRVTDQCLPVFVSSSDAVLRHPNESNSRAKGLCQLSAQGYCLLRWGSQGSRNLKHLVKVHLQSGAESHECLCSAGFLFFIQARTQPKKEFCPYLGQVFPINDPNQ